MVWVPIACDLADRHFNAELKDVEPPPAHPPCALSSLKMKQYNDRSQRTIASMFGPKKTKASSSNDNGYVYTEDSFNLHDL